MLFLFCCDVVRKLLFYECLVIIGEVTSRFLICLIINVIYRFESLGCYNVVSEPCRSCPDQNRVILLFVLDMYGS